ncbi:MAG: SpoIIE family protein phosphatase [Betaproteobacteria bacterium]|nr:SpoIIE family protein phosphatase [Betaproteobacteria bacterium]
MTDTLKPLRILAVDDNKTNLHVLQVFLKKLGHQVLLAENGEEAVQAFEAERPDMVLLDIMMPVMDGFEAARRIRALVKELWVPVIFLSALNRDENLLEGLNAGGDDYLTKPINFIVLEAKLRSMQKSLTLQAQSIEALKRLQAISDNVLEAIITIDTKATILACNSATEKLFGWPAADLIGQNVKVLMPEPYHSEHDGYVGRYVGGEPPRIMGSEREVIGKRRDGALFPAELGVSEIQLDNTRLFIGVVRDISERKAADAKLHENARQLQAYYDQTESEQQLAMRLVEKQMHRRGLQDPSLQYKVIPAEHFSGDVVAAARSPQGRFYALLADATGHGLAAAISVLPVLTVFYRMSAQNLPVHELIRELNQQLRESMPIGRFVAATVVALDPTSKRGEIWVGGTPAALLIDRWGRKEAEFPSTQVPLGIIDQIDAEATSFTWEKESQLFLYSDGLIEATDREGRQFGPEGILGSLAHTTPGQRFDAVQTALRRHLGEEMAADDVSLMVIACP